MFIELTLKNPLDVGMLMNDVHLICDFTQKQNMKEDGLEQDKSQVVRSDVVPSFVVEPKSRTKVRSKFQTPLEGNCRRGKTFQSLVLLVEMSKSSKFYQIRNIR